MVNRKNVEALKMEAQPLIEEIYHACQPYQGHIILLALIGTLFSLEKASRQFGDTVLRSLAIKSLKTYLSYLEKIESDQPAEETFSEFLENCDLEL